MKKHCPQCKINIDEVMGLTQCPICSTSLQDGFIESNRMICFL